MNVMKTMGFVVLAGAACLMNCAQNTSGPADTAPVTDPDGLLWANSGWRGFTAVDLAQDTVYEVLKRMAGPSAIAVGQGFVYAISGDDFVSKISTATRTVIDSAMISSDTGTISMAAADADNLWVIDTKNTRSPRITRIAASDLAVLASNPVQTDTCVVGGIALCGNEAWLCHTNPPTLSRANPATGAIDVNVALPAQITGTAQLCIVGRTAWVLSTASILAKVNLDTRTVAATYDLSASFGTRLAMAGTTAGLFIGQTGTTPLKICRLTADTVLAGTFETADTSLTGAMLSYLRAKGSRLVAVVARGWYNQYAEINVPAMTLMRGIDETYCYGMEIE